MYLIRASMSGQFPFILTTLPPGLYEMASGQTLPGSAVALDTTGNSGSFSPGLPGSFPQNSGSGMIQAQLTGKPLQPQYSGRPLQPQFTSQVAQNQTSFSQPVWDVTPTENVIADKHFDGLDTQKRGYIESDVAVPFMLRSKLPGDVLASIWLAPSTYSFLLTSHTMHRDLADLNNDGRITRDGFAVAFHLIRGKLNGKEIPTILPASLMPPSMRVVAVPTASPFQQPPSDLLNDLLWEDSPVTSHLQSTILQPQRIVHSRFSAISATQTWGQCTFGMSQYSLRRAKSLRFIVASNKDLLDDDDDGAGAGASRAERNNVEATVQNQGAQLSTLQTQLGSAKAAYGAESRLLATLHERFSNQSSEIQKVKEELIRAESELSAIRLERAEVEQNLLHDKGEIRNLQRKMTETGSTIEVVKAEIEKAQKEAKQQKGLLVIARKQLATREAERAKISQELQEAVAEVEEVTREREMTETELLKELTVMNTSNGLPFAPSPSLSRDSVPFSAAQPHPGEPGSPSFVSGSLTAKRGNPFAAGSDRQLLFHHSSVPNEGTTTDNPFTFDQAFGDEEARPGPDVEEPSTGPKRNVQPSTGKIVAEPRIVVNEEVSELSSDHDLFIAPQTSALDALGASGITSAAGPDTLKLPSPDATSPAPSTDRPPEAHTDINSQLKAGAVKEAVFPPVVAVGAAAEAQSTNPFSFHPAKNNSPFPASTSPFAVSPPEPPKVATSSNFDKAFGDFPGTAPTAGRDQFDTKAEPSASSLPASTSVSSSGSSAFPPAPTSSGIVKPLISPVRETGFENAFRPQRRKSSSARPMSVVDHLPVLPPVPESHSFSFGQAFSSDVSSSAPVTTAAHTTPSQLPPVPDAPNRSFDDAVADAQTDSGFESSPSSRTPSGDSFTSSSKKSGKIRGRYSNFSVSGHSPASGVENMTFMPILDPSALWEEEEDTGFIATTTFLTLEPNSR
jgi:epidermal growth factor receptor substrate 15